LSSRSHCRTLVEANGLCATRTDGAATVDLEYQRATRLCGGCGRILAVRDSACPLCGLAVTATTPDRGGWRSLTVVLSFAALLLAGIVLAASQPQTVSTLQASTPLPPPARPVYDGARKGDVMVLGVDPEADETMTRTERELDDVPPRHRSHLRFSRLAQELEIAVTPGRIRVRVIKVNENSAYVRVLEGPLCDQSGWVRPTSLWPIGTDPMIGGSPTGVRATLPRTLQQDRQPSATPREK
jgi:hypothetical protein